MRRLKYLSLAASAVIATTTLTACGPADSDPASVAEVRAAFAALGDSDRLAVTISADLDDRVIDNLLEDVDDDTERDAARALLGSAAEFKVVAPGGTGLTDVTVDPDPWSAQFQFTLTTPGAPAPVADVRFVDETLYLGTDGDALAELGVTTDDIMDATDPGNEILAEFLAGTHLGIDRETLETLPDKAQDLYGVNLGTDELDREELTGNSEVTDELAEVFTQALDDNATTEAGDDGYTTVTVDSKGLLTDALDAAQDPRFDELNDLLDDAGPSDLREMTDAFDDAPSVEFDVKIDDGELTDLRIDLTQFAGTFDQAKMLLAGSTRADINIAFDTDFEITAPEKSRDAVELIEQIEQEYTNSSYAAAAHANAKYAATALAAYAAQNGIVALEVLSDPGHRREVESSMSNSVTFGPVVPMVVGGKVYPQTVTVNDTSLDYRGHQCPLDVSGELAVVIAEACS